MKHRGSRDQNHAAIVEAFVALGCTVIDTALAGLRGYPLDLIVGCVGVDHLVEIKNPDSQYGRRGLTKDQTEFALRWRGGRVAVVYDVEMVALIVQKWRADCASQSQRLTR